MEGRCETCKHWWQWDTESEHAMDIGYCHAIQSLGIASEKTQAAIPSGGALETHRSFGCRLWAEPVEGEID